MTKRHMLYTVVAIAGLLMLQGAGEGGCGEGLDNREGEPGVDVGGAQGADWEVHYEDQLSFKVKKAGAVVTDKSFTTGAGGVIEIDGEQVDISQLCARQDVACPHEVFPKQVNMRQPGSDLHLMWVTFNPEGPLADVKKATLAGNVDSDFDFSIFLGIKAAAVGTCGLLGLSYATGHIDHDGGDPPRGTRLSGRIVTEYSGGCLLLGSGGNAGAGIQVEISSPFSATRLD